MSKDKALAVKKSTGLVFQDLQNEFSESIQVRRDLLEVPRLKLNNAMSQAVNAGLAQVGDFSCLSRGKNYGKEVTIIPLIIKESASFLDKETSEVVCSTHDLVKNLNGFNCNQCPHKAYWNDWGTKKEPKVPKCKASIDMIVLIEGDSDPVELNFRKNNHKAGRALLNLIVNDPKKIPFGRKYKLHSQQVPNGKFLYQIVNPSKIEISEISADSLSSIVKIARNLLEKKKVNKIVMEVENEDAPY